MSARAENCDSDKGGGGAETPQTVRLLQIDIITSEDLGSGGAEGGRFVKSEAGLRNKSAKYVLFLCAA